MKKIISFALVGVLFLAVPHVSFAWGKVGHGIVAEIAFSLLDTGTQQKVKKYLGSTTIEGASTWMDEVRSDHKYDYMKTWHYVNIAKGTTYTDNTDENIVNALNKAITELEHRDKLNDEDIKKRLMIIFHLAGDLHMPLHCGYEDDKGGNTVEVKYLDHTSNLHRVWDTEMIESEKITANDCLPLLRNYSKQDIEALKKVDIKSWIFEPRALLSRVYDFKDGTIDQAYIEKNKKTVETQLLIAGIRLSAILQQVFNS